VIGRALDPRLRARQSLDHARELAARLEQQRVVIQAGVAPAGAGGGLLDEDEEAFAARAHRGDPAVAVVQLKAERALIERDRSVERRHSEMDPAEAQGVGQARGANSVGIGAHGAFDGTVGRARHRLAADA